VATTTYGRAFLALADPAAGRTALGLGTLATQSGTFLGTSSGTNTGDQTTVSGNAGTATKLTTARNIEGQAFDGSAAITVIAPGTHAATGKTTPVDADELPLADSAASFVLKKLTWANLKATLKAYFDTLYFKTAAPFFWEPATGQFYASPWHDAAGSHLNAFTQSVEFCVPFPILVTKTVTSLTIRVFSVVAGSTVRLGIRADNAELPGALLLDAGTVDSGTARK
jgi:hypothetical protein